MNKWKQIFILLALLGIFITGGAFVAAQTGSGYTLTWSTVDGGGGSVSGGGYALAGTAGQPDAATISGGGYTLAGGFWHGGNATGSNDSVYLPVIIK
jgi:hypothetical protein